MADVESLVWSYTQRNRNPDAVSPDWVGTFETRYHDERIVASVRRNSNIIFPAQIVSIEVGPEDDRVGLIQDYERPPAFVMRKNDAQRKLTASEAPDIFEFCKKYRVPIESQHDLREAFGAYCR